MSIKISLKKSLNIKSVKNHVFFTNENFRISELSKLPIFKFSNFITKSVSTSNLVKKNILSFNINATQKIIFKRMLKEVHEAMKEQSQLEVAASTYYAYEQLISGIKDLFPESWMLVRYFKYYSGTSEVNQANQMDVLNVVIAISKRDRSKFERLEFETQENTVD